MIDGAPTSEKARAMFEPTIIMTRATTIPFIARVWTKLCVYEVPLWVILYIQPMNALDVKLSVSTNITSMTVKSPVKS